MRLGIHVRVSRKGGTYQYTLTMLESLQFLQQEGLADEFLLFSGQEPAPDDNPYTVNWPWLPLYGPKTDRNGILDTLRRVVGEGAHRRAWRAMRNRMSDSQSLPEPDAPRHRPQVTQWLRSQGVELMVYPQPTPVSFEAGVPYIMAIHDLQHRLQPEFPEVSVNGAWERREYLYRNCTRFATLLLADSEVGKEDILNFYAPFGVTPDRVKVLPFLPSPYLNRNVHLTEQEHVLQRYGLRPPYLFYPAHFWPHKNHARIVKAISLLKVQQKLEVHVVFVGNKGDELKEQNYQHVINLARQGQVANQVHYLGFVPDRDMSALYAAARGLIIPTFFGPTIIPPLEAWSFGCPVITSDIRGIREQIGDAGILVDPRSVESIAAGIVRVWTDESLRQELSARGRARLASYTPADYRQRLKEILEEAKARVRSGDTPRGVVKQ